MTKVVCNRKTIPTKFFKTSVYYHSSYTESKIDGKNLQLPMKTYSVSMRLLNVKDSSGTNLRDSHPQLSGKCHQYGKEDCENRIVS